MVRLLFWGNALKYDLFNLQVICAIVVRALDAQTIVAVQFVVVNFQNTIILYTENQTIFIIKMVMGNMNMDFSYYEYVVTPVADMLNASMWILNVPCVHLGSSSSRKYPLARGSVKFSGLQSRQCPVALTHWLDHWKEKNESFDDFKQTVTT